VKGWLGKKRGGVPSLKDKKKSMRLEKVIGRQIRKGVQSKKEKGKRVKRIRGHPRGGLYQQGKKGCQK